MYLYSKVNLDELVTSFYERSFTVHLHVLWANSINMGILGNSPLPIFAFGF
jgi:hypothetical protein